MIGNQCWIVKRVTGFKSTASTVCIALKHLHIRLLQSKLTYCTLPLYSPQPTCPKVATLLKQWPPIADSLTLVLGVAIGWVPWLPVAWVCIPRVLISCSRLPIVTCCRCHRRGSWSCWRRVGRCTVFRRWRRVGCRRGRRRGCGSGPRLLARGVRLGGLCRALGAH